MAVKELKVFECDLPECGKLAKWGQLPEGWAWYLHETQVAMIGPNGQPTGKTYPQREEHEFCSEKHRDEWIKQHK